MKQYQIVLHVLLLSTVEPDILWFLDFRTKFGALHQTESPDRERELFSTPNFLDDIQSVADIES